MRHFDDFSQFVDCDAHSFCKFFFGRFSAKVLSKLACNFLELVDCFDHMNRNSDCSSLISDGSCDCLSNPPCCIGAEFVSSFMVEFFSGSDESQVSFLNEVEEEHASADIFFCDADNQTEVCLNKFAFCNLSCLPAFDDFSCEFDFFFCCQELNASDFTEIHSYRVIKTDALN